MSTPEQMLIRKLRECRDPRTLGQREALIRRLESLDARLKQVGRVWQALPPSEWGRLRRERHTLVQEVHRLLLLGRGDT